MKTITISDETADFLLKLNNTINTQNTRYTRNPIFFTIQMTVDVPVPEGCGDEIKYFDNDNQENYTKEEAKERAKELEMEFDDYIEQKCQKYDNREENIYEGFFLTLDGYNEHVRLNGHNIIRKCKSYCSYVDHLYRNPEIETLIKTIIEIGHELRKI